VHRIGDIIDERYQLIRPLGIRQGAEWWEAEHEVVGRKVSLELLRGDLADDPDVQRRLIRESRAAAEIGHPTVVDVYDIGATADGEAFLVTERLHGEVLADLIARQGSIDPPVSCRIAMDILGGLGAAHAAGMVHGSLQASKVILRRASDGKLVVKILDFGLDESAAGPAADIVAVGAILRELLAGQAVGSDLGRIVDDAADARIAGATELSDLLAPFAAPPGCSSLAPRDSLIPFLSPEARRSRGMARLEKAVLGDLTPQDRASGRPNLVLLDAPASRRPLPTPKIPRPPIAPEHFASQVERPSLTFAASTGWTAGLLVAGITVGLLLARLLHL
jgi:serine/threonine protein kinase